MNRKFVSTLSVLLLCSLVVSLTPGYVLASQLTSMDLTPEAKSAILMDMDTGTVMYEKNSDLPLPPASITKIMTMLLIMEAIDSGKITWADKVRASERAASMGGSQIFLEVGEEMTVEDLMKGIAIASGNDATVALAEYIAGTEESFVEMMNAKAEELGLTNTHFKNTNGLPEEGHYTSARDVAIISRELLKHEEVTRFTKIYEDYLRKDSDKPFWLVNTNRLVRFYDGVDGLKTGYTSEAKYCLAATAKRGDMRVIAVVMGAPTPKERNLYVTKMLDYAFSQFETHPIYKKGEVLGEVRVDKGKSQYLSMVAPHQVSILTKKGESLEEYQTTIRKSPSVTAPVNIGDVLAQIVITKGDELKAEVDILATERVEKASFWQLLTRAASQLFGIKSSFDKEG